MSLGRKAQTLKYALKLKYVPVRPCLSQLLVTGIPATRHKTASNGYLPMHSTPLIRKPRYPDPTRKFRNGYVRSIEKKTLNRITPTVT